MDLLLLGPALYKIAWGLVAPDAGLEAALEQQGQDLADPQQVDGSDVAD